MKLLKYILLFLFSLLLNINVSAKEIVIVENQNVFFSHYDSPAQGTSIDEAVLSCKQIISSVNPNLIDSWKKLSLYETPASASVPLVTKSSKMSKKEKE